MRLRKHTVAAVAALALTTLAACGGDDSGGDASADDTTTSSSDEPTEPTEDAESSAAEPDDSGGESISAADFQKMMEEAQGDGQTGHMEATFDISAGGQQMEMSMEGDFEGTDDPAEAAADISLEMQGQEIQMVMVDKALYMSGTGISASSDKPWVKIDLGDPNSPFGDIFETANPQSFTDYMSDAQEVEVVGEETVDGVDTTHYELTVSTKEMMAGNPALGSGGAAGMPKQITIGAWLNDDDLPVQMVVPFGKMGSMEAHFSEWGEPLDIKAPPASQVTSLGAGMG